ncbi:MAG TPA: type II secretion system protein N [Noviherbaspirillum sp.]|jgi:general secretion pathway protein C|uniref:type II secretion system protein N n=1 Tax=Noviherbaspirillum sp. TaxID=1926288 RepID=UPI002DDCBF1A|nr:type II secretion system protein N [Noviherbaspirillum sp.]HEV2611162.1 type II secretion system protein N [Noviherbaspirillum sp.]
MKRWPLIASFVLFIALCASAAYWAMQLFKPPVRPVAAPPRAAQADVNTQAAAALFGGRQGKVVVASNYQLRGVISSGNGRDSVAILSADGKPAQAVRMNMEIAPGVTVKEVHRGYVLLSEGGVTKRVELPESAKGQVNVATVAPMPRVQAPGTPMQVTPPPAPRPSSLPSQSPPPVTQPGMPAPMVTPANPGNPAMPATSGASGAPGVPAAPGMPGAPGTPMATPGTPGAPGMPTQAMPQTAPVPRSSVTSAVPAMNGNPAQPATPGNVPQPNPASGG